MREDAGHARESDRGAVIRSQQVAGYVSEMFCSVQGEGLYVGERHLFFRMAGCKATCYWCDTPASKKEREHCVIHGRVRRSFANPLGVEEATREVLQLASESRPAAVSITGGEPLEQPDFVAAVAKQLKKTGLQIHLETNGLEVEGLAKVRPFVDVVAMDIKLPHAMGEAHWDTHEEFLRWLVGRRAFVKIVVDSPTPLEEIETAVALIAEIDRRTPLVLQPESATYLGGAKGQDARRDLLRLLDEGQRIALESLEDVRVIPQCHKIMRVR
jgi:organic radical activating enzyme